MPYKDKSSQREYQRLWINKKRRAEGIPLRVKGEDPVKIQMRQLRWRYGDYAGAKKILLEMK